MTHPTPRRLALDWRPILLESFFVVLGVVLALAANEVREAVVNRREAAAALAGIREELAANRRAVLESAEYHLGLSDTLSALTRSAREGGPPVLPDAALFSRGFIHPAQVLSTAWEAAGATEAIAHMRYADVLTLSRIYEEQRSYHRQSDQVGGIIYGGLFSEGFGGMLRNHANLNGIIGSFWYRECQLLASYDAALAKLGAPPSADARIPPRCSRATRPRGGSR